MGNDKEGLERGRVAGRMERVVVPIVKKGDGVLVEEYRGVTVMPTLYKVYASVLAERLVVEMEEGRVVPENQTGFRRGMGTMDNVYVLNYLINRRTEKPGGKMVALFIDLKAAFDSVDREVLWRAMEERGVSEDLRRRIEEIYTETRSRVRVGGEEGENFWTARGVRQGCPLSPHLFNVLTADLEEELRKGGWGGVRIGGVKVRSLAYADDVVLVAEDEGELRGMIGRLEWYLDRKKLELNVEKTKIMRFAKGGGRR